MMSHITDDELTALQLSGLPQDTPFVIAHVSEGMFSVARYSGGCTYHGKPYLYAPETDELIRSDVVKWLAKYRMVTQAVASMPQPCALPGIDG